MRLFSALHQLVSAERSSASIRFFASRTSVRFCIAVTPFLVANEMIFAQKACLANSANKFSSFRSWSCFALVDPMQFHGRFRGEIVSASWTSVQFFLEQLVTFFHDVFASRFESWKWNKVVLVSNYWACAKVMNRKAEIMTSNGERDEKWRISFFSSRKTETKNYSTIMWR